MTIVSASMADYRYARDVELVCCGSVEGECKRRLCVYIFCAQELTVFLRAAQTAVASPHAFLAALSRLITQHPEAALTWPADARVLLQQTLQLHRSPSPTTTPTLGLAYDSNQSVLTSTMRNAAPSMNIVMPRSSLDSAGYPRAALGAAYQAAVPLGGSSVAASLIPRAGSPNQAGGSRLLDSAPAISLRVAQYEGLVGRDSPVCQQDGQSLSSVRSAPEPVHLMLLQQLDQLSVSPGRGSPEAMPRTSAASAPVLSGVPGKQCTCTCPHLICMGDTGAVTSQCMYNAHAPKVQPMLRHLHIRGVSSGCCQCVPGLSLVCAQVATLCSRCWC